MNESKEGTIFWFGNHQRGIVVQCLDPEKGLHEIIYHQNQLKWVKQDAYFVDGQWHLSDECGRVIHDSEFPDLVRALKEF